MRTYWSRVLTVWFLVWSLTLILGMIVILPSYILINSQSVAYEDSVLTGSETREEFEFVTNELKKTSQQVALIRKEASAVKLSEYFDMANSLEGLGVTLNSISVTRNDTTVSDITLSGKADDRLSLSSFRDRLLAEDKVESVDLPISNLAQDKDINFNLKVVLAGDNDG